MYGAPHREVDWNALYLVQLFRAYGDRYCNHSRATEARLRSIIHESPRHPDWAGGVGPSGARTALRFAGQSATKPFRCSSPSRGLGPEYLRKEAEILLDDIEKIQVRLRRTPAAEHGPVGHGSVSGPPDSLAAIRGRFAPLAPKSVAATFLRRRVRSAVGEFRGRAPGIRPT